MEREFEVSCLTALPRAAAQINRLIEERDCRVVLLRGGMGAGKTTLVKEICACRGVEDVVASPTFALINEYVDAEGVRIHHFDLYRVNNIAEVLDLGYEEYFYGDGLSFVEWPERIKELISDDLPLAEIFITSESGDRRLIVFKSR